MKKIATRLLLLFVFGFIGHIALAQSEAELKQMIEKNNKIMIDAVKADDVEKAMALYHDDIIQLPSDGKIVRGKDAVRRDIESHRNDGWNVKEYSMNIEEVELNGNIVTEIGTYKMAIQKEGASDSQNFEGNYLTQWEKQADGALKLKTEIWNYDSKNSGMASGSEKDTWNDDPEKDEMHQRKSDKINTDDQKAKDDGINDKR